MALPIGAKPNQAPRAVPPIRPKTANPTDKVLKLLMK